MGEKAQRLRTVALNALALALGGLVAQGCFVAIEALIARRLGPEQYGIFGTVFSLSLGLVFLVEAGINWRLIEIGSKRPAELSWLLGTSLSVRLGLFALWYPLLLLALPPLGYSAATVQFFALFFVYALLLVVHDTLAAVYSAQQRMHVSALFQAASPLAILVFTLIMPLHDWQLMGVGAAYIAGITVISALWLVLVWREHRPTLRLQQSVPLLKGSLPYGLAGLLDQLAQRTDILVLSMMRPMAEVGLFVAAHRIFEVCMKAGIAVSRAIVPMLFKLSAENATLYAQLCVVALRFFAAAGAGLGLVIALTAQFLMIGIFGDQYAQAAVALQILACALALRFIGMGMEAVLVASGHQFKRTGSLAVSVAADGVIALAMIPQIGVPGAAVARLGGSVAQLVLSFGGVNVPVPPLRVAMLIATPMAVATGCFFLARMLPLPPAAAIIVALLLLPCALLLLGYFRLADLRQLLPTRQESK